MCNLKLVGAMVAIFNEEKEIDVHKIKISPKYIIVGPNMDNYYSYSNNDGEEYMRKLFPEFKQVEEDC